MDYAKIRDEKIEWMKALKVWIKNKVKDTTSYENLEVRANRLDEVWLELKKIESKWYEFDPNNADLKSNEVEDSYFDLKASIIGLMRKRKTAETGVTVDNNIAPILNQIFDQQRVFMDGLNSTARALTHVTEHDSVKLPKVSIAKFDGSYKNWPSFDDSFTKSIHDNESLTGVIKLKLLKTLLCEGPLSIIKNLLETEANYIEAWRKLKERYSKQKLILNSYVASFFDLPSAMSGRSSDIRKLADMSDEILIGIKTMGPEAENRDSWLIQILLRKLDSITRQDWSKESVNVNFPTFLQFLSFLNKRCDSLEDGVVEKVNQTGSNNKYQKSSQPRSMVAHASSSNPPTCSFCRKTGHSLNRCTKFKFSKPAVRCDIVKNLKVCENCLKSDHTVSNCQNSQSCFRCKQRHHTLIHPPDSPNNQSSAAHQSYTSSSQPFTHNFHNSHNPIASPTVTQPTLSNNNNSNTVTDNKPDSNLKIHVAKSLSPKPNRLPIALLPTALIVIYDRAGHGHFANALLDSGSQCNFISESLVQRVGLSRFKSSLTVSGLGPGQSRTRGVVHAEIASRFSPDRISIRAHILSSITSINPPVASSIPNVDLINTMDLADPKYHSSKDIDILIGADLFFSILKSDKLTIDGRVVAQSSFFGWVVLSSPFVDLNEVKSMTTVVNDQELLDVLNKFWALEEPPMAPLFTSAEDECESHFQSHAARNSEGRFVVKLPFKSPPEKQLGHSRSAAVRRLIHMERRFEKNDQLKSEYHKFMAEYHQLNHMELVPPNELAIPESSAYYLPHHAVLKPDNTTTKLRVVFDGSCKSTTRSSLNDLLLVGPTIQFDLVTILNRFRVHPIVFSGDIEKMYRQIRVNPADANYQRIVWRNSTCEPISTYRLTTVTYGTSCAPFLAVRCLQEIANLNATEHPKIADIIRKDFYVDDLLSGCESSSDAVQIVADISKILNQFGFPLRKWKSNSVDVLNSLDTQMKDPSVLDFEDDTLSVKTLGLRWIPSRDCFTFSINIESSLAISTKRSLLSEISRVFDPLGWLAPVTINMKMLFQKLWTLKMSWDDELPENVLESWNKLRSNLKDLKQVELSRHLYTSSNATNVQLHGFSDASISAYAAVVYIRVTNNDGTINTNLVMSKTKVAPIKQVSLPRLELCGAHLLANLITYLAQTLDKFDVQIFAWTDSEIVLSWLSDVPQKWKTFIANRTSKILEKVPRSCWGYVASKQNPADCPSRGISPNQLLSHDLWWTGPKWLSLPSTDWPSTTPNNIDDVEIRNPPLICATTKATAVQETKFLWILERYSKLYKAKRFLSYLIKFGSKAQKGKTVLECVRVAEYYFIKEAQQLSFTEEIKSLKKCGVVDHRSKLLSLNPFIDGDGVLRVGGRLALSSLPYNVKHPIILPNVHKLTHLIIAESHEQNLHPGPTLQMSLLKQKFWIVSGRNVVRKFIKCCQICFRQNAANITQLMGDLPKSRITPSRPFLTTGMDYAGPILLKSRSGRGNHQLMKGYICLFVCFGTKAVHLELVTDMTSEAFIPALRRFCGRRGVPSELVSDNGTNFKGAKKELNELYQLFQSANERQKIYSFLSQKQIKFSFNPASAPHFGGLWESNIKSMKHHLSRATVNVKLTYEEMSTLLCQVEGILNSRPLCPMSSDPDDLGVLTPGHFLIGEPITTIPEPPIDEIPESRLSKWQNIQRRMQGFWKNWSVNYLHTLQTRAKWRTSSPNLEVGDLVLIKDSNLPPTKWAMGRIIEVHPGEDELVRVATLKTANGIFKRPVAKLAKLPMPSSNNQDDHSNNHNDDSTINKNTDPYNTFNETLTGGE